MNEEDSKTLSFVLLVIRILLTISLIWLIGRLFIWLIGLIINGYETHSHNKALKNVVKLFYKWRIKKEDLDVKEVKKLKKALDITGLKCNAKMEDIKNMDFSVSKNDIPILVIDNIIYQLPSLTVCKVKHWCWNQYSKWMGPYGPIRF